MKLRTLPRRTVRTAVLAMALVCARAQAAAPPLPATAIAEDTYIVANINVPKLDPTSLEASAKVVLGANYAMAADGLAKYKAKYTDYVATGAESVTFVMSGDPTTDSKQPEPIVYVKMKAGADHAALEKKIRDDQAKEGKPQETEITNDGDFMVMRKKGIALPTSGSADRTKAFGDIAANDAAFSVSFIPTDKIRAKMKEDMKGNPNQPPWVQQMGPFLTDSKWMILSAKLGDAPALGVTVQAADDSGAKGISDAVTQGGQQLKAQADQMRQAGPQFAGMADAFGGLADALKPTQAGSKVSLNIDGKVVGPAVSNLLPFMMMGAGGGGPKPGPNPGQ